MTRQTVLTHRILFTRTRQLHYKEFFFNGTRPTVAPKRIQYFFFTRTRLTVLTHRLLFTRTRQTVASQRGLILGDETNSCTKEDSFHKDETHRSTLYFQFSDYSNIFCRKNIPKTFSTKNIVELTSNKFHQFTQRDNFPVVKDGRQLCR